MNCWEQTYRKNSNVVQAKVPNKTSFGPEETEDLVLKALQKDRKMKQVQREGLTN